MKLLKPSTQFRKDYKKIANNPQKVAAFQRIANYLISEIPIPPIHRPHTLKGKYNGYMECHIESDFLLIWMDEEEGIVELVRLGSHSELFKKIRCL